MSYSLLRILPYVYYCATSVAIAANLVLIWLILKRTNRSMKEYSQVLMQAAIVDIFVVLILCFLQCQMEVAHGFSFARSPNPVVNSLPGKLRCISVAATAVCVDTAFVSIPVQSIFRYYLIVRKQRLSLFKTSLFYLTAFAVTLFFAIFNWRAYSPVLAESEPEKILADYEIWSQEPDALQTFCVARVFSFGVLSLMGCTSLLTVLSLSTVFYTTHNVGKFLVRFRIHLNRRTIDMQTQFSKMILAQTILPILMTFLMLAINITGISIQKYQGGLYLFLLVPYSIIFAVNPLTTIFCIKIYRNNIFSIVFKKKVAARSQTSAVNYIDTNSTNNTRN